VNAYAERFPIMHAFVTINRPGFMPDDMPEPVAVTSVEEAIAMLREEIALTAEVHDMSDAPGMDVLLAALEHGANGTRAEDEADRMMLGQMRLLIEVTGAVAIPVCGYVHTLSIER